MAKSINDEYLQQVIKLGDEGSELLAKICAPTLRANSDVRIIGPENRVALKVPDDYRVFVHSTTGEHYDSCEKTAESLVSRLFDQALAIGAAPVAMTNIIDSSTGDTDLLRKIAEPMAKKAGDIGVAIINGENAILGDIVRGNFNISGTMISIAPKSAKVHGNELPDEGTFDFNGNQYAHFYPIGQYVIANSDGIGTKIRFYQRNNRWFPSLNDFLAMILDDQAKIRGVTAKVASGVIECEDLRNAQIGECQNHMGIRCGQMGILGTLQPGIGQLREYKEGIDAYNIGGTAVGVVSEEDLEHPLAPVPGDAVIAIKGRPNPRSNGISDKRKRMIQLFGQNWHETEVGKIFLEYLAEPSTVFYPLFKDMIDHNLATGVFHMSGGAYNGKFARPLAKNKLFARIENLFAPDWRELTLIGSAFDSAETAYAKYHMGNEGFITTGSLTTALEFIEKQGLHARVVGSVYDAGTVGKTGLELRAFNGDTVYFSGK